MKTFIRIRIRALLYHLRMKQGFTQAQIRGTLILFCFIITLICVRYTLRAFHEQEEELTLQEKQQIDSMFYSKTTKQYPSFKQTVTKKHTTNTYHVTTQKNIPIRKYDLNQADSLQLISLKGIGPVLAGRILKFRKSLGGFYRKEQLYEIWGLDSVAVNKILPNLYIADAYRPVVININKADYSTLKDHPYISPTEASAIMKYKKKKGKFLSLSEVESLVAQYNQLKYYLDLD